MLLARVPMSSKEYSCVNLPLLVPTCFRGWSYQRGLSSSRPGGMARGCTLAPLPLPSHTSLEEEKPTVMFTLRQRQKQNRDSILQSLTLSEKQTRDSKKKKNAESRYQHLTLASGLKIIKQIAASYRNAQNNHA